MRWILPLLLLAACGHQIEIPKEVLVEVAVPCVKSKPTPAAIHTAAQLRAASEGDHVGMLAADRLALRAYARQLERIIDNCSKVPQ